VLVTEQYLPFRHLIAANMRHFGALRLDHVMALFRQWWVPVGLGSTAGGYVHYPLDDLMSVLALESERHDCLVVGEDLGTVPPEMSHAMGERAVYSYRVLLFEKHPDGTFIAPRDYPRRAIATVTTHDLPTLRGYWSGRATLPCATTVRCTRATKCAIRSHERIQDRSAVAGARGIGIAASDCHGPDAPYDEPLAHAVQVYLARSAAALVVLQAEDLDRAWPDPVNVPGTSDENRQLAAQDDAAVERAPRLATQVRRLFADIARGPPR
jgi:4-alpha-glucanotransferase